MQKNKGRVDAKKIRIQNRRGVLMSNRVSETFSIEMIKELKVFESTVYSTEDKKMNRK